MATTKNLKTVTDKKVSGKPLQEQLGIIADILSELDLSKKEKAAMSKICDLFKSGNLVDISDKSHEVAAENEGLEFEFHEADFVVPTLSISDEQAKEISEALTIGDKALIKPEKVKDIEELLVAVKKYVDSTNSALEASGRLTAEYKRQTEELGRRISETDITIDQLKAQRAALINEKGELNNEIAGLQRYKRASKAVFAAVATVLSLTTLAAGVLHIGLRQKNKDQAELAEIREILENNGYTDGDMSDYIENLYTTQGDKNQGNNAQTPDNIAQVELEEIINALKDGGYLTEDADVSDIISGIIKQNQKLSGNETEINEVVKYLTDNNFTVDGIDVSTVVESIYNNLNQTQVELDSAKEQLAIAQGELDQIEEILVANGAASEDDISLALEQFINGLNQNGGVTQNDVDDVYETIASVFAELGVTEDSLKDENGNYSTDKISEVFAEIIDETIENRAVIENVKTKVGAILNGFTNEDTNEAYTLEDFESLDNAIEFIEERLNTLSNVNDSLVADNQKLSEEKAALETTLSTVRAELADLKGDYDAAIAELETLKTEAESLRKQVEDLTDENNRLNQELAEDRNPSQSGTDSESESDFNQAVSDKEVDESTNPSQDNKNNKEDSSEEEVEPGN